jgi:SAM-dependent methyltransferase
MTGEHREHDMSDNSQTGLWVKYFRTLVKSFPRKRSRLAALLTIMPPIAPMAKCLDIGTGSGGFALFYTETGDWTFVEPNAQHIAAASKILSGNFVQSDGVTFLRDTAASFDVITTIGTLYYIPDRPVFFALVRERLRQGGHFVVSGDDLPASSVFYPLRRALGIIELDGGVADAHSRNVKAELAAAGLQIQRELRSTGVATMTFQTILDAALALWLRAQRRLSSNPGKAQKDLMTIPVSAETKEPRLKRFWHLPLRAATELCWFVDQVFWFLPNYDYVIWAQPIVEKFPGKAEGANV